MVQYVENFRCVNLEVLNYAVLVQVGSLILMRASLMTFILDYKMT